MSGNANNNGLEKAEVEDDFPKFTDSSASDFRLASLVALGACPLVLYGSFTDTTWMVLLGILLGPLTILFRVPGPSHSDTARSLPPEPGSSPSK